jgi:hypothetical protein
MRNAVFWDIKTHFVPHRRHITSPLQSPAGLCYVRFEVFTAMTMKNAVFWVVTLRRFCKNDVSEKSIAHFFRMTRIDELGQS